MKVNILMSTFNGQEFLADQIRSIQEQTYTDWTLLIRDDGSKDKTREIIANLSKRIAEFTLSILKVGKI